MDRSFEFSAGRGALPPVDGPVSASGALRVLLVGTDALALAGLAALLSDEPDLIVIEQPLGASVGGNGSRPDIAQELTRGLRIHHPDVVLCDLRAGLPEPWLAEASEHPAPLLALAEHEEAALAALRSGARGVTQRDAPPERLAAAVRAAAEGLLVVDDEFSAALTDALGGMSAARRHAGEAPSEALTAREREVLGLLAEGLSNRGLAQRLGISEHTAKFHVNSILAKLDAQTRTDAVVRAVRLGLILL